MPGPGDYYKTPNGKIATEEQLKAKYGEKFESLVGAGTFSKVGENIYTAPTGDFVGTATFAF